MPLTLKQAYAMWYRTYLIPLTFLLFSFSYDAPAQVLRGVVYDAQGGVLEQATVFIEQLQIGAVTDRAGAYAIEKIPNGTYSVEFRFIGYEPLRRTVAFEGEPLVLNVVLHPVHIHADEVVVADERADMLTRNTRSVAVLDAEKMTDLRGQTLGETLEHLSGVTTLRTGPSIAKPVVRGLHSQRVLVLNNGVSQEGQQWGGEHAPEIDPFAPVRIEVIKGVAGVEYGIGAIGGVIRVEPEPLPYLPGQPMGGSVDLNGFANNRQGAASMYLEGTAGLPGLGWRVQGSVRKAGDAHTPDYVIQNSAFRELNGSLSVGLVRSEYSMKAHLSHFGTELGIYSGAHVGNVTDLLQAIDRDTPAFIGVFDYGIAPPKQQIQHDLATVEGEFHLAGGHRAEVQYGIQRNHRQEFDAHRGSDDAPAFELTLNSQTLETRFIRLPRGVSFGVIGLSGKTQTNRNGQSGFLIPNFRSYSGGAYARESWIKANWTLEAGVRFDYYWVRAWPRTNGERGDFQRRVSSYASTSGVLGAIWSFAPNWSFAANLGTGWRPPSVNELYNFGVHHGTAQFERGDPDLGRERNLGVDGTLRHSRATTQFEMSAYYTRFDGYIFLYPEPEPRVTIRGTFPSFVYKQAGARLAGIDASAEHQLMRWLSIRIQGAVLRGDNLDDNEPIISLPADRLVAGLTLHANDAGRFSATRIGLESTFVARQHRFPKGVDYADPPPGYTLLNAHMATNLAFGSQRVRVNLSIENILNTRYRDYLSRFRYFIDEPGRSIALRMNVPLGNVR